MITKMTQIFLVFLVKRILNFRFFLVLAVVNVSRH